MIMTNFLDILQLHKWKKKTIYKCKRKKYIYEDVSRIFIVNRNF